METVVFVGLAVLLIIVAAVLFYHARLPENHGPF